MTASALPDGFAKLPLAELHLHLEGSIAPSAVVELAARHGIRIAREEAVARYSYSNFAGFIESFKWVTRLLREPADFALLTQQLSAKRTQNASAGQLTAARGQVSSLQAQLTKLQNAPSQPSAPSSTRQGGGGSGSSPSGPIQRSSSGSFTFPMPKGDVSPPATWSLDEGVDISAPGGTPELAVCSGTVVLHGIGGFGPSAPVLHCDSPLAGYDYVYYGHAGPGNWTPVGTHVSQGQVISQVGYGDVGISTGPHLEIGFADSSGSPVGPSSAPQMMSLLRSAYGA